MQRASKEADRQRSSEMATDPSEFVSIFSPGGTRLTLPPASPAGSEAGGVGSAQSSQTPAQQGAAGSVVQKILGGPSGSIGSVGGGSDTAGSKTGATEPVTPAPVSPARIGDGPGEQRAGAQSPPVMMSGLSRSAQARRPPAGGARARIHRASPAGRAKAESVRSHQK